LIVKLILVTFGANAIDVILTGFG